MSISAESTIRKFLAAWENPDVDKLVSFFSSDAVYIDGPRGVHRGREVIRSEWREQLKLAPGTTIDVKNAAE
jgi:limonene-1,2-epoxide hydrolase